MLDGAEAITCRPADLLEPELEAQTEELKKIAVEQKIQLADDVVDDVLTYALFPQIGLKFLENRNNPDAFEASPDWRSRGDCVAACSIVRWLRRLFGSR